MREEGGRKGSAFAHDGDDCEGFETVDEFLLDIFGGRGVVVGEECVVEDGDFECWLELFEMRRCYALVVVKDGYLDWCLRNGRHLGVPKGRVKSSALCARCSSV